MRKIFMLILFFSELHSQSLIEPRIKDFKINSDEEHSTFVQTNPNLFYNNPNEFVIAWEDYRDGIKSYYAQYYDSQGNKLGSNVIISSNKNIAISNSTLLSIEEKYINNPYNLWGTTSISMLGTIYDNNHTAIINNIPLGAGTFPWCGTGWLGHGTDQCTNGESFFYGFNFGGELSIWSISETGYILFKYSFLEEQGQFGIGQFSVASTSKSNIVTWFNAYSDTLATGLYSTIFNDTGIVLPCVALELISDSLNEYFWGEMRNLITVPINDSLFQIYYITSEEIKLNSISINNKGEKVSNLESFSIISNAEDNFSYNFRLVKFGTTEIVNNKYAIYITISEQEKYSNYDFKYHNSIYFFDTDGDYISKSDSTTRTDYCINGKPFFINDTDYFTAGQSQQDIFLFSNNSLSKVDSTKVNDDEYGSNENNPKIFPLFYDNYLISWNNESKKYAKMINKNGYEVSEQFIFDGIDYLQLTDDKFLEVWKKNLSDEVSMIGIYIQNSNRDILHSDTLLSGDSYYTNAVVKPTDSSRFAILYTDGSSVKIRLYDDQAKHLKEVNIGSGNYIYNLKLDYEDENSFWVRWKYNVQLFSNSLEPLNEGIYLYSNIYLGGGKFLQSQTEEQLVTTGIILSENGDTLAKKFIIAEDALSLEYKKISNTKFLVTYSKYADPSKYYGRIFLSEGIPEKEEFTISLDSKNEMRDLVAELDGTNLIFAWSDLRSGNIGFDIYSNIFDLNDITNAAEEKKPISNFFFLKQNYPNPFNPTTTINYSISPELDANFASTTNVKLMIYDLLGREIATIVKQPQRPGNYSVQFDGTNLSSGIYYYRLEAGSFVQTKKMILLK